MDDSTTPHPTQPRVSRRNGQGMSDAPEEFGVTNPARIKHPPRHDASDDGPRRR